MTGVKLVEICVMVPTAQAELCERELLHEAKRFGFVTSHVVSDSEENRNKFYSAGLDD